MTTLRVKQNAILRHFNLKGRVFPFGFIDSHRRRDLDGTAGSGQRERVPEMECRIYQTHAGVRGFSAESGQAVWVSGRIWRSRLGFRPKPTLRISLLPHTERDPAGIPRIPAGSLFLYLSLSSAGVRGWQIFLPLALSPLSSGSLFRPLSFSVAGRRMN
jgi:hypothetical protein